MEKTYLKFGKNGDIVIEVYPFNEKDIFILFDLEDNITITEAYIRIFANDTIESDFVTWITEVSMCGFNTLKQLSEFCNLPFDRDINQLSIVFTDYDCCISLDDGGGATFRLKNSYKRILKSICRYIANSDFEHLYNLVNVHKDNYICFIPENKEYKIYTDYKDMIQREFS